MRIRSSKWKTVQKHELQKIQCCIDVSTDYGHKKAKFLIFLQLNNRKHGQGTHCTEMGADRLAKNNPNAPKFTRSTCLPMPKSSGFHWKKASLGVSSPWTQELNEKVQLKPSNFELGNCLNDKFNQVQSEKQYIDSGTKGKRNQNLHWKLGQQTPSAGTL